MNAGVSHVNVYLGIAGPYNNIFKYKIHQAHPSLLCFNTCPIPLRLWIFLRKVRQGDYALPYTKSLSPKRYRRIEYNTYANRE